MLHFGPDAGVMLHWKRPREPVQSGGESAEGVSDVLARTRRWVESWDRVKDMPEEELKEYLVKKCRNGYQMAKKPSRDQRDAWVTLLAEADKKRDELSPLAMRMVEHVQSRLDKEGYDFELNLDDTGGVAYAEVHFKTLTKKSTGPVATA
jgi:hypothetical protein